MNYMDTPEREALNEYYKNIEKRIKKAKQDYEGLQNLLGFIESTRDNDKSGNVTEDGGKMLVAYVRDALRNIDKPTTTTSKD